MRLHVDSDAVYLVHPKARSHISEYYYMDNKNTITIQRKSINGPILIEYKVLQYVVTSATEACIGGFSHNAQITIPILIILEATNHPQPLIPIKIDNKMVTCMSTIIFR